MPSLATRIAYQNLVLKDAEAALVEAAQQVSVATNTLAEVQAGTFNVDAVRVGGTRFINSGGSLVAEP